MKKKSIQENKTEKKEIKPEEVLEEVLKYPLLTTPNTNITYLKEVWDFLHKDMLEEYSFEKDADIIKIIKDDTKKNIEDFSFDLNSKYKLKDNFLKKILLESTKKENIHFKKTNNEEKDANFFTETKKDEYEDSCLVSILKKQKTRDSFGINHESFLENNFQKLHVFVFELKNISFKNEGYVVFNQINEILQRLENFYKNENNDEYKNQKEILENLLEEFLKMNKKDMFFENIEQIVVYSKYVSIISLLHKMLNFSFSYKTMDCICVFFELVFSIDNKTDIDIKIFDLIKNLINWEKLSDKHRGIIFECLQEYIKKNLWEKKKTIIFFCIEIISKMFIGKEQDEKWFIETLISCFEKNNEFFLQKEPNEELFSLTILVLFCSQNVFSYTKDNFFWIKKEKNPETGVFSKSQMEQFKIAKKIAVVFANTIILKAKEGLLDWEIVDFLFLDLQSIFTGKNNNYIVLFPIAEFFYKLLLKLFTDVFFLYKEKAEEKMFVIFSKITEWCIFQTENIDLQCIKEDFFEIAESFLHKASKNESFHLLFEQKSNVSFHYSFFLFDSIKKDYSSTQKSQINPFFEGKKETNFWKKAHLYFGLYKNKKDFFNYLLHIIISKKNLKKKVICTIVSFISKIAKTNFVLEYQNEILHVIKSNFIFDSQSVKTKTIYLLRNLFENIEFTFLDIKNKKEFTIDLIYSLIYDKGKIVKKEIIIFLESLMEESCSKEIFSKIICLLLKKIQDIDPDISELSFSILNKKIRKLFFKENKMKEACLFLSYFLEKYNYEVLFQKFFSLIKQEDEGKYTEATFYSFFSNFLEWLFLNLKNKEDVFIIRNIAKIVLFISSIVPEIVLKKSKELFVLLSSLKKENLKNNKEGTFYLFQSILNIVDITTPLNRIEFSCFEEFLIQEIQKGFLCYTKIATEIYSVLCVKCFKDPKKLIELWSSFDYVFQEAKKGNFLNNFVLQRACVVLSVVYQKTYLKNNFFDTISEELFIFFKTLIDVYCIKDKTIDLNYILENLSLILPNNSTKIQEFMDCINKIPLVDFEKSKAVVFFVFSLLKNIKEKNQNGLLSKSILLISQKTKEILKESCLYDDPRTNINILEIFNFYFREGLTHPTEFISSLAFLTTSEDIKTKNSAFCIIQEVKKKKMASVSIRKVSEYIIQTHQERKKREYCDLELLSIFLEERSFVEIVQNILESDVSLKFLCFSILKTHGFLINVLKKIISIFNVFIASINGSFETYENTAKINIEKTILLNQTINILQKRIIYGFQEKDVLEFKKTCEILYSENQEKIKELFCFFNFQ